MKSVLKYIQEKLIIKKGNYKGPRELPTTGIDTTEISKIISYQTPAKEKAHYDKMKAYKKKGSDPKRLAKSIKDKTKLINRWYVAIDINWIDCAVLFRYEIINRGFATEDELDVYILNKYNHYNNSHYNKTFNKAFIESIEEYFDEIGIKYE